MAKFKTSGQLEVQGVELQWHVRHWGGASNAYENHRGLSVSVCVEPNRTKELIIDFPFTDYFFDAPKSELELNSRLRSCVEAAMEAGWHPHSRGRSLVYSVAEGT